MSGEVKLVNMPSCLKKKVNDGMIRESSKENLILVIKYCCIGLVSDFCWKITL